MHVNYNSIHKMFTSDFYQENSSQSRYLKPDELFSPKNDVVGKQESTDVSLKIMENVKDDFSLFFEQHLREMIFFHSDFSRINSSRIIKFSH